MRANLHRAARFQIVRIAQHAFEIRRQQPPRFAREYLRGERALGRHIAFHRVRDGVVTGGCGHRARLRTRQQRIENRQRERRPWDRRKPSSRAWRRRKSARSSVLRCRCRPWSGRRSSAASAARLCRSPSSRACLPPLVRTKLMPLAQSSELPPPSPMSESTAAAAANARPASTIAVSGFAVEIVKWEGLDAGVGQQFDGLLDIARRSPCRDRRPAACARSPVPAPVCPVLRICLRRI